MGQRASATTTEAAAPVGGELSFELLYRRHADEVFGYALSVLGDRAEAEDATQAAFLNAYRALDRGKQPTRPRAWLYAIVRNVCRRRFRRQASGLREVELDPELAAAARDLEGPTADELGRALAQLRPAQREALVLREVHGLSYDELSDRLEVSRSAVEGLLFRARSALREQLEADETPLACADAERFVLRQLEDNATPVEKRALRAHLRTCSDCARFARTRRAGRRGVGGLSPIPLFQWLFELLGRAGFASRLAGLVGAAALSTSVVTVLPGAGPTAKGSTGPDSALDQIVSLSPEGGRYARDFARGALALLQPRASAATARTGRPHARPGRDEKSAAAGDEAQVAPAAEQTAAMVGESGGVSLSAPTVAGRSLPAPPIHLPAKPALPSPPVTPPVAQPSPPQTPPVAAPPVPTPTVPPVPAPTVPKLPVSTPTVPLPIK